MQRRPVQFQHDSMKGKSAYWNVIIVRDAPAGGIRKRVNRVLMFHSTRLIVQKISSRNGWEFNIENFCGGRGDIDLI